MTDEWAQKKLYATALRMTVQKHGSCNSATGLGRNTVQVTPIIHPCALQDAALNDATCCLVCCALPCRDGYTDLRGRFDYVTLTSTADMSRVTHYSLLVASRDHGAVMLQAAPPPR